MTDAITYQCPDCGGVLRFDFATGVLTCDSCGNRFEEAESDNGIPLNSDPVNTVEPTHAKTVDDFLKRAPWNAEAEEFASSVVYSCPSCGASVVADQSTVSTSCPYCGNNMLVSGTATVDNIPRWILPFSVTKEQALDNLKEHFKDKRYLPRAFSFQLEHLEAVYVPYYLYDIYIKGAATLVGFYVQTVGGDTRYIPMAWAGNATYEKVPVDGSSKMPDGHMDAIAPFDFDKLREFSTAYVAGCLMEVPDESAQECYTRAKERAKKSFDKGMRRDVIENSKAIGIEEMVDYPIYVEEQRVDTCALPVWLAHGEFEGKQLLFAVNGDTGKCVGDLPIDKRRRFGTMALAAVLAFALMMLILVPFHIATGSSLSVAFALSIVAAFLAAVAIDARHKAPMRTAVEAADATESDNGGFVATTRRIFDCDCSTANKAKRVFADIESK